MTLPFFGVSLLKQPFCGLGTAPAETEAHQSTGVFFMQSDIVLQKLNDARNALAEARTIQDTKKVLDAAIAQEIFWKRQKMSEELVAQATEFKVEALRQLGTMLKATERNTGARGTGNNQYEVRLPISTTPTLAEMGIDKKTSKLAQDIASLPEEKFEAVKRGVISISKAQKEANIIRNSEKPTPKAPDGKYRVIYADPPWKYTSGDQHGTEAQDTILSSHYNSMSIAELCELPIKDMAQDDSVLFMWVTSPLLEECFDVIRAWGFKYKASIVWNKDAHNVGHYVSVRHELLLICTRGSCLPDTNKLFASVVTEKRTAHSVKPETFRNIVDEMYPNGKRIELFARRNIEGWDSWGNDV